MPDLDTRGRRAPADSRVSANETGGFMQVIKHLLPAISLSLVAAASLVGSASAHPSVTAYCIDEPVEASTGGGSTFRLGAFIMKARLTINGSHYILNAWNVMPDNSQILEIHADGTYRRNGSTPIRFIDNFDNRGRGSFTATKSAMHLEVERVKASELGRNIGRNYGAYDLKSKGCKWEKG
jgi:hypothetical protein